MRTKTEPELLALCLRQDDSAFAELMRRYKKFVQFETSKFIFGRENQKDVIQIIWIKMCKIFREEKYKYQDRNFGGFLKTIIFHESIDWLRKNKKKFQYCNHTSNTSQYFVEHLNGLEILQAQEIKKIIQTFQLSLGEPFIKIFILRFKFHLHYEEIAEYCDMPLGTVQNRIFKIRKKFEYYLQGYV